MHVVVVVVSAAAAADADASVASAAKMSLLLLLFLLLLLVLSLFPAPTARGAFQYVVFTYDIDGLAFYFCIHFMHSFRLKGVHSFYMNND